MTYHITLAQELRTDPARPQAIQVGDQFHATDCETRLSVEPGDKGIDLTNPNLLRVIEWDLQTRWIVIHKGADVVPTCVPGGWPDVTQEQYDAQVSAA